MKKTSCKPQISGAWTKHELSILQRHKTPEKIQDLLDNTTYRCESGHFCARSALRDGRAHCFDGALLAAAALRRGGYAPKLIDLCAENDDDHILCAYQWRGYWGVVAKSNFPGLRYREPIFKTPRELALSFFELYFNMKRYKSLRSFSKPLMLPDPIKLDWECNDIAGDVLVAMICRQPHYLLANTGQVSHLRRVDRRFFKSQLLGVNLKGVY